MSDKKGIGLLWFIAFILVVAFLIYSMGDFLINGPRFFGLVVEINNKTSVLPPNSRAELLGDDLFLVRGLRSNIPLNLGVRLEAKPLDYQALRAAPQRVRDIVFFSWTGLHDQEREIVISAFFGTLPLGSVVFTVRPFVEDWIERGQMILDKGKKVHFLSKALEATGYDTRILRTLLKELEGASRSDTRSILNAFDLSRVQDTKLLWSVFELAKSSEDPHLMELVGSRLVLEGEKGDKVYQVLGGFWEGIGDLERAETSYKMALKKADQPERELLLGAARVLIRRQKYLEAKELLVGFPSGWKDQEFFQLMMKLSQELGEPDAHLEAMDGYLRLAPGDLDGRIDLVSFLFEKGLEGKAKEYVEEVLERSVGEPEVMVRLAKVLERSGNKELLLKTYLSILREGVSEPVVLFNTGSLEFELGRYKEAKDHLEAYREKEPRDEMAVKMLLDIYRQEGDTEKVIASLNTLLENDTKEVWVYQVLCDTHLRRKEAERAIKAGQEGLRSFPEDGGLYDCAIAAYLMKEDTEGAERLVMQYLERTPKDPQMLLRLSEIRELKGDLRGAMGPLEEYLGLRPNDMGAQERYLRLRIRNLEESK